MRISTTLLVVLVTTREPSVELLLVEVEVAEEVLLPALPVPRPEQVPSIFDGMVGLFGCRVNERLEESSDCVGGKELYAAASSEEEKEFVGRKGSCSLSGQVARHKKNRGNMNLFHEFLFFEIFCTAFSL